jgi:hypothetical protein
MLGPTRRRPRKARENLFLIEILVEFVPLVLCTVKGAIKCYPVSLDGTRWARHSGFSKEF